MSLVETITDALNGLLIRDLQDLVISYLPDSLFIFPSAQQSKQWKDRQLQWRHSQRWRIDYIDFECGTVRICDLDRCALFTCPSYLKRPTEYNKSDYIDEYFKPVMEFIICRHPMWDFLIWTLEK